MASSLKVTRHVPAGIRAAASQGEVLTLCTYGFSVPCRQFLVTANITQDKRLPVVDEFVLRALKLCERLPVRRLGTFFGFSERETETVLSDLVTRGLITVDGDHVLLHASANEHFRGTGEDGVPRLVETETWFERLWFDLVSRNMMAPERTRSGRNLIDIRPEAAGRELPTAFARKAFEDNFAEYLRKVRRLNNPDRIGLYSISDVQAGRFGFVVLKGREDLVFDPQPRIDPRLLEVELADFSRYRLLSNAVTDAYRRLSTAEPSATALGEYGRLTDDRTIHAAHVEGGRFDFAAWQNDKEARASPDRRPLLGASYIKRNVDVLVDLLEKRALLLLKGSTPRELELVWLRPAGSGWGASPDLLETLSNIRAVIRRELSKAWVVRTTLVVPHAARQDRPRRFDRVFDRAVMAPPGHLSPAIEVVLLRGIAAIVLVRVMLSPSAQTSVGSALVGVRAVERVEAGMRLGAIFKGEELWARATVANAD